MCTDPVACKGAGIDWTVGPIVDIIAPQPPETGCCYPTTSMDSPLSSFLVYQGQVVSLVGQTQVCSRAFAAKPAGQASPWLGFHTGKNVSLPLRLTWRISQMELGDSGAENYNSLLCSPQTHRYHSALLCFSPLPPSYRSPHPVTELVQTVEMT